ncbi:MAG: hypothetical protein F4051_14425 [Boseongicola sp. SB0670_bin_30]|nr:hypothetical protein [Boseongicola sp. SB0670_bin_30]
MPAAGKQRPDRVPASGLPPQSIEDQGRAEGGDPGVRLSADALGKDRQALDESRVRAQELVDGVAGTKTVDPAERGGDHLPVPFAFAAVLDDPEALVRDGPLDADEHGGIPFMIPHDLERVRCSNGKTRALQPRVATCRNPKLARRAGPGVPRRQLNRTPDVEDSGLRIAVKNGDWRIQQRLGADEWIG